MMRSIALVAVAAVSLTACRGRDAAARADSSRVESRQVPAYYAIITDSLGITPDRVREVRSPTRLRLEIDYVLPPPPPDSVVMLERAQRTALLLAKHGPPNGPPPDRVTIRVWLRGRAEAPLRTYHYKGDELRAIGTLPAPRRGW